MALNGQSLVSCRSFSSSKMKVAIFCILAIACAFASEDARPKRSLLAYPAFYSGAALYGAPVVAPYGAPVVAPAPLSPVIARASTVVGQPGFVPRYGYPYSYPYGLWPGSAAVYLR